MDNAKKTLWFTTGLSAIFALGGLLIQIYSKSKVGRCSYLDPILFDISAFIFGGFLIIEGAYFLWANKDLPLKNQFTRSIRVAIGFGILAVHILQFIHK